MGIQRATFLVDPDGRIAHVWPKVKADGHAAEVLAALDAAQAARAAAPSRDTMRHRPWGETSDASAEGYIPCCKRSAT